jgi:hypothetical protein
MKRLIPNRMCRLPAAFLLCAAYTAAFAQDDLPAVDTGKPPGVITAAPGTGKPDDAAAAGDHAGTTIFGERESPIGLYITPWRDAHAEKDIDRPARLLQEKPLPIDRVVFGREVEYYNALTAELKKKGIVTPEKP